MQCLNLDFSFSFQNKSVDISLIYIRKPTQIYIKDFSSLFLSRIIRYEDLMSDLDGQIPQFLSSLGLPMQTSVKRFVYRNTSPSEIRYSWVEFLSGKVIVFMNTVKSRAVDRSTIQFWNFLAKDHST